MIAGWWFLITQFVYATCLNHEQPVALVEWQQPCTRGTLALNDCNWCKCTVDSRYKCGARVCREVDVFGHFNDAIALINTGMDGMGFWRSTNTACEPGVQYRRSDLICICNEDGTWPNPVCRDIFRVLHMVEAMDEKEPNQQKCSPTKLYLIGCNVCFCPSTGNIDPTMCTNNTCTGKEDGVEIKDEHNDVEENSQELAIYATCTSDKQYKMGCKNCICLKNNRIYCDNCTETQLRSENVQSHCRTVEPGEIYNVDCNQCFCDENGSSYCTVKKCLPSRRVFSNDPYSDQATLDGILEERINSTRECEPGQTLSNRCTQCECHILNDGRTSFTCVHDLPGDCDAHWTTVGLFVHGMPLRRGAKISVEATLRKLTSDCVVNTAYEHNCHICRCSLNKKGQKYEVCQPNPKCENTALQDLNDMHGYCEPMHVYKKDCNICKCLIDGKTVRCTSHVCNAVQPSQEPITIDIVPVTHTGDPCPNGSSYRIDCNVCFCLSNGNAICTTIDCKKSGST